MQKWEYMTFWLENNNKVTQVNGVSIGSLKDSILGRNPYLPDFLSKIGEEGWEVVASVTTPAGHGTLIAKRPKP